MPHELPLPPAAVEDARSLEMIRVWLANHKMHCVLNIGFWEGRGVDDGDAWGILLADMVHHIANAHEAEFSRDPRETIARVRAAFEREMLTPTSKRLGDFLASRSDGA